MNKNRTVAFFTFWLLIAIVGTGLLFAGLQNSIQNGNITVSVMYIVIGIILTFLGLVLVIGSVNIEETKKAESKKKK